MLTWVHFGTEQYSISLSHERSQWAQNRLNVDPSSVSSSTFSHGSETCERDSNLTLMVVGDDIEQRELRTLWS